MPHTDIQEVRRRRASLSRTPAKLPPLAATVDLPEKMVVAPLRPMKSIVTEQPVIASSLHLPLCFAVLSASFIFVLLVLMMTYNFTLQRIGLIFFTAIADSVLLALTTILIDRAVFFTSGSTQLTDKQSLFPSVVRSLLIVASLWWVATTTTPTFGPAVPVARAGMFVWSVMSLLASCMTYLFNAYTQKQGLGAFALHQHRTSGPRRFPSAHDHPDDYELEGETVSADP